jgi:uncharacterized protein YndB with AHSA1/START domain
MVGRCRSSRGEPAGSPQKVLEEDRSDDPNPTEEPLSKFTNAAATAHTLSLTAMEEASRYGQRTAVIDHMFLALVVNEQLAGQVLRSLGITLDSARDAVTAQHAAQLESLGISTIMPEPGEIVFHQTAGYQWGEGPLAVIKKANESGARGDAAAALRELVVEPSGMIEAILHRLNTTPQQVISTLDKAEQYRSATRSAQKSRQNLAGVSEGFAPAAVEQVWALLADPLRMPDWEPSISAVTIDDEEIAVTGSTWQAHARTQRLDGKPIKIKPSLIQQRVELLQKSEPHTLEWRFTYPDAPSANARRIRVELEPAAGGTHLRLSLTWERNPQRTRLPLIAWVMRPLARALVWLQLSQLSSAISRNFR